MYYVNLWDGWRGKDSNVIKTISKSKGIRASRYSSNNYAAMFQQLIAVALLFFSDTFCLYFSQTLNIPEHSSTVIFLQCSNEWLTSDIVRENWNLPWCNGLPVISCYDTRSKVKLFSKIDHQPDCHFPCDKQLTLFTGNSIKPHKISSNKRQILTLFDGRCTFMYTVWIKFDKEQISVAKLFSISQGFLPTPPPIILKNPSRNITVNIIPIWATTFCNVMK